MTPTNLQLATHYKLNKDTVQKWKTTRKEVYEALVKSYPEKKELRFESMAKDIFGTMTLRPKEYDKIENTIIVRLPYSKEIPYLEIFKKIVTREQKTPYDDEIYIYESHLIEKKSIKITLTKQS